MKLAVIPARGGSKRIPRKNIKVFSGKPIIAWSIEAALSSLCFDAVIVSTDDPEIAEVAKSYGASVPFLRPLALAGDHVGTVPVITHAIDWFNSQGAQVSEACCIYATAPFITVEALRQASSLVSSTDCDYAFTVTRFAYPIQRSLRLAEDMRLQMFYPEQYDTRSQDLEEAYHDAGQFYWGRAEAWMSGKPVFDSNNVPVILPRHRVQDIDTPEDWAQAELMFKVMQMTEAL